MRGALSKTRQALSTDIRDLFKTEGRLVDDEFLQELFSRLIRTDMGVASAEAIRDDVATRLKARVVSLDEVLDTITQQTEAMLLQESTEISTPIRVQRSFWSLSHGFKTSIGSR